MAVVLAGCAVDRGPTVTASGTPPAAISPSEPPPEDVRAEDYDAARFADPTTIDNEWFPLTPGTQFIYEGKTTEDGERLAHRVVFTVTDLVKVIDGVPTLVVWDRDYVEGELVEAELGLFAQDENGNVWHLGEYPEEYDDGQLVDAPAWVQGLEGATAGIEMRAAPRLGASDYAQGFAPPPINWVDRARVYQLGQSTCVPFGCYDDVLVIEEFELDKPDAFQLKFYARGVGVVRVGWRGAREDQKEKLALVDLVILTPDALAEVRQEALLQDERGFAVSKDVWAHTPPAGRMPGAA